MSHSSTEPTNGDGDDARRARFLWPVLFPYRERHTTARTRDGVPRHEPDRFNQADAAPARGQAARRAVRHG